MNRVNELSERILSEIERTKPEINDDYLSGVFFGLSIVPAMQKVLKEKR